MNDFATILSFFGLGVCGGLVLYIVFSLVGYGIYSALKLFKS